MRSWILALGICRMDFIVLVALRCEIVDVCLKGLEVETRRLII